jgi:predicted ATP-binding protein involved in virulence
MKIKKIYIEDYKVFHDFTIDFTNNEKVLNLVVLAGVNGSGKSTLLRDVMWACMKDFNEKKYTELSPNVYKIGNFTIETTENHNFSVVMDILEDLDNDVILTKQVILRYIDKLIFENNFRSSEAYQKTNELLNEIFHHFNLHIFFHGIDRNREIMFRNGNDNVKIENLSSGERMLITRTFSLYLSDYKNSVILIDEPESSLHPAWQNRIAAIYQKFADDNNNQIIMSTHSPHILSSVRKEQIRVLAKDDNGNIVVYNNFLGAYGWRVDKILTEILGMENLRTPDVEDKLEKLNALLEKNEYNNPTFKSLYEELENDLGYTDTDLVLIRLEEQRRRNKQ